MGQLTLEMDGVLVHWRLQWGESISTIPQVGHCVPTFFANRRGNWCRKSFGCHFAGCVRQCLWEGSQVGTCHFPPGASDQTWFSYGSYDFMWQFGGFFGLTVWHSRKSSFNAIFKSLKITCIFIKEDPYMVSLGTWCIHPWWVFHIDGF